MNKKLHQIIYQLVILTFVSFFIHSSTAIAADQIIVNTAIDLLSSDKSCSLRESIILANAFESSSGTMRSLGGCSMIDDGNAADTQLYIILSAGETYSLTRKSLGEDASRYGDLDVSSSIVIKTTVEGEQTTIDAGSDTGLIDRVLHVQSGYNVKLQDLVVTGGYLSMQMSADGAGIFIDEGSQVELQNTSVSENSLVTVCNISCHVRGGGIYISTNSSLMMTQSVVSYNTMESEEGVADGAGLYAEEGSELNINLSSINNNSASSNSSPAKGGAIYALGKLNIDESIIDSNSVIRSIAQGDTEVAGGGIYATSESFSLTNSTVSNNLSLQEEEGDQSGSNVLGGGIAITYADGTEDDASSQSALIQNTTISNNTASNLTSSGTSMGGAIYVYFLTALNIESSSIIDNTLDSSDSFAAGINADSQSYAVSLSNSILAYNTSDAVEALNDDCTSITSLGYNLISTDTCGFVLSTGDITNTDPAQTLLGDLADNGGNTFTHAILEGSVLIDAGSCNLATDQRAVARDSNCDIGAYEYTGAKSADEAEPAPVEDVPADTVQDVATPSDPEIDPVVEVAAEPDTDDDEVEPFYVNGIVSGTTMCSLNNYSAPTKINSHENLILLLLIAMGLLPLIKQRFKI
jgi:hypothetical protein